MTENYNQPSDFDAVLGGQDPAPLKGMVLGGLEGIKKRFLGEVIDQRIAALKDALKYKRPGLDLVIQALQDESDLVQRVAYLLLWERTDPEVQKSLHSFNHYRFFDCLRTLKGSASIAISPDSQTIATLHGKTIRVWHLQAGELLYSIDKYPRAQESFIVSRDGEILVRSIDASSHLVEIWHLGERLHTLYGHQGQIAAIALSPDSQTIASGSFDKTLKIWHLQTGKLLFTISNLLTWKTHKEAVLCLAFSPDGQTLVSGSADRTIKLWNLRSRNLRCTLKGHASCIQSIVISPDGNTLASASWDRTIRLWDLSTGETIRILEGHSNWINCLAFSPDGGVLASGSGDQTIKLWNVQTGQALHTILGHGDSVSCLAFSWDGQTLVSGSQDKTIKVWGLGV